MRRVVLLVLVLILPVIGLVITVELVKSHLTVYGGGLADGLLCGGGDGRFDCNAVAAHESAWMLGLPLAVWGLLYFIAMTSLGVGAIVLRAEHRKAFCAVGALIATAALLFDLYLAYVMVTKIGSICLNCVATYAVNLGLALTFWRLGRGVPVSLRWRRLLPSWAALRAGPDAEYYCTVIKSGLGLVTLVAASLSLHTVLKPLGRMQAWGEQETQRFLDKFAGEPAIDMARFEDQPSIGPAEAELTAVLVGDFQCSHCRSLAGSLERWRRSYPERIRLIFVNSPVSSLCNPAIPKVFHEHACWLAEAGECAARQGRFWEYHDFMFHKLPLPSAHRETVLARLEEIGLDVDRFHACMESGDGKEAAAADIALCRELGLTATPSLVINGHAKRGSLFPWMLRRLMKTVLNLS